MLAFSRALAGRLVQTKALAGEGYAVAAGRGWVGVQKGLSTGKGSDGVEETHDDFKPQIKQPPAQDAIHQEIEKDVKSNSVFVFMKGVPQAPMCGFSAMVCRILDEHGVDYKSRNVLEDEAIRQGIKSYTNWPTVPQVFVKGEFIGGCDILINMHKTGELSELLSEVKG